MNATLRQIERDTANVERRCGNPRCRRWLNGDYTTLLSAEGDKVAYRWTWRETRERKQRTADGVSIQRIVEAKIAESVFWMKDVTAEGS